MSRGRLIVGAALAFLAVAGPAQADPGGVVTDDPAAHHDDGLLGVDGAGISWVQQYLGAGADDVRAERRARNVSLVGSLALGADDGTNGDVAAYRNLAFLGRWREGCPATGVDIIDISRPSAPVKVADTLDRPDTSMEDMQAMRIGGRDVLAIGLQDCNNSGTEGVDGLELYDISRPADPQLLALVPYAEGVHELDLTRTPDGRTLALLAIPNLEATTSELGRRPGTGDLVILDISDPANPVTVGEYGVLDDLGVGFYLRVRQGGDARTLLHSVRANANGTRAYLSYWDAGVIILDISDPAHPLRLGRTEFAAGEEGNAHSIDLLRGENVLVQADEDYTPFGFSFTSSAFSGQRPAIESAFTPLIATLPGRAMAGEIVHVGRGCPAGSIGTGEPADPYLADPAGKIALVERGVCRFDNKVARAQQAGATGVVVYNSETGGEALVLMGGVNPVTLPDGTTVTVTIPAVFVQRSTGVFLHDGAPPVTARAAAVFNGWGYLRLFDISDPGAPAQIGTFATRNSQDEAVALDGTWSVHNPEVRGSTIYASWYADGIQILDVAKPAAPREIGSWTGQDAPEGAPPVNLWSVVPHGRLLLASDRTYGLYVLSHRP